LSALVDQPGHTVKDYRSLKKKAKKTKAEGKGKWPWLLHGVTVTPMTVRMKRLISQTRALCNIERN